jgi:3-methyl-2-oxobutanoate hydroxymethyltransferase
MITAYDFPMGRTADSAGVDIILVGDSLAMVVLGHPDTLSVTLDEMIHHTKAVRRGVKRALLVADMPYGSFHLGPEQAVASAIRFVKESGAQSRSRAPAWTWWRRSPPPRSRSWPTWA